MVSLEGPAQGPEARPNWGRNSKRTEWVQQIFCSSAASAEAAVVYCKTVGVPKGCVVRQTAAVVAAPVVAAPVAAAAVATPGVGAPGVGVRAGTPMNRGGPINRVGRR